MEHNCLRGRDGINALLAADFNFHLLLRWLAALLRAFFLAAFKSLQKIPKLGFLTLL